MDPRSFNVLIDKPPEEVEVNGREYKIRTDFRVALAYLRLVRSEEPEDVKNEYGLSLFYGDEIAPQDIAALFDYMGFYLRRGRPKEETKGPLVFDILEDAGRIFAAFLQVYGINLRRTRVHWWVFGELLEGLPQEGTRLAEVIDIRRRPFEKWMKPGQRNELQRMKDRYKIGGPAAALDDLFEALKGVAR